MLDRWQDLLRLDDFEGSCRRISQWQVTDEDGTIGAQLVGVVVDGKRFIIVHTRDLTEHDVIHELLHVAFPRWEHALVEHWTDVLFHNPGRVPALFALAAMIEKQEASMSEESIEVQAFNLRTRRQVTIKDPQVVTMKNGRKAVVGTASDDGTTRVFRILGEAEAERISASQNLAVDSF